MAGERTETPHTANPDDGRAAADPLARRIAAAVTRARLAILWEALWPRLALTLGIVALFLAISWMGLWPRMPDLLRLIVLGVLAVALLASLVPLVRLRMPSERAARDRVERVSGLANHPLAALEDEQIGGRNDPVSRSLWQAHRTATARRLGRLAAGIPSPRLYRRDPFVLRALAGLLLFVGLFAGFGEYGTRIADAFRAAPELATGPSMRLDAWVDPPAHTNRPPIFLTGETPMTGNADDTIAVPEGSRLTVRLHGVSRPALRIDPAEGDSRTVTADVGGDTTGEGDASPGNTSAGKTTETDQATAATAQELTATLSGNATVAVLADNREVERWRFTVDPDAPPTIALADDPAPAASGALELSYRVSDDYGVLSARADIAPAPTMRSPQGAHPLYEPPSFPLTLPRRGTREGTGRTIRDLSSHPFAGGKVRLTLTARDAAGQEGHSEPRDILLPQRPFSKPLARALVEQRRDLALDARNRDHVRDALDALMIAPEAFTPDPSAWLGMRFAYRRLVTAKSDDDLREVADLLWALALSIEDGELSLARNALRDAQEALRKALENDASDEEIQRLTEDLRKALDRFMAAMAEQAARNPQSANRMPQNMRTIDRQQLQDMLSRIEELARSGSHKAARDLLSEMQRMMENLQTGRSMPQNPRANEMNRMLEQLADMIGRQRSLMDETFRMQRRQNGNQDGYENGDAQAGENGNQRPMTAEELEKALKELRQRQEALQKQLDAMRERMAEMGVEAGDQLGDAGRSMGNAGRNLGKGDTGSAVGNQGDALSALQQGAGRLLDQMMAEGRGRQGQGQPGQMGRNGRGNPLGPTMGPDVSQRGDIPGEIDVQRARRILEELRRRLGESGRPQPELDYLDRLLPRD